MTELLETVVSQAMAAVDGDRLWADLEANAEFGRLETEVGHGRTVLPGTEADRQCRSRFVDCLEAVGLDVQVDCIGNISGRYVPAGADPDAAAVASGSHLDSVPHGGIFDGPLGVYGALEAVRAIDDAGCELARPIEVVSFTDEEGHRFADSLLGSGVATGRLTPAEALSLTDDDGVTMGDALEGIGFAGEGVLEAAAWDSMIEMHIEQGLRLERSGLQAGIVTKIAGQTRCLIEISGEADHAGVTAMDERTDALTAAAVLVQEIEAFGSAMAETNGTTVTTVGKLEVEPGAINVIPGQVSLSVDIRDTELEAIEAIVDEIRTRLDQLETERGVETTLHRLYTVEPVPMASRCQDALAGAAALGGIGSQSLHSGAGHDGMMVASVTDTGMVFVPSQDGRSHSPLEWTDWEDCTAGVRVLTGALTTLASESGGGVNST